MIIDLAVEKSGYCCDCNNKFAEVKVVKHNIEIPLCRTCAIELSRDILKDVCFLLRSPK